MLNALTHTFVFVTDQDEALEFYVGKLGFEVHTDAPMGDWRWLTINLPGNPDHEIVLMVPGPPAYDPETEAQLREALSKGALSVGIFTTDDCRASYEALRAKGVEFTQEPTELLRHRLRFAGPVWQRNPDHAARTRPDRGPEPVIRSRTTLRFAPRGCSFTPDSSRCPAGGAGCGAKRSEGRGNMTRKKLLGCASAIALGAVAALPSGAPAQGTPTGCASTNTIDLGAVGHITIRTCEAAEAPQCEGGSTIFIPVDPIIRIRIDTCPVV